MLVVIAMASGCGDSDEASDALGDIATSELSKAEFVRQANQICSSRGDKAVEDLIAYKAAGKSEDEQIAEMTQSILVPAYRRVIDEIHAMGAPPGDAAQIEAFLEAMQEAVDEDEANLAPSIAQLLPQVEKRFEQTSALARDYGLDECVYG